MPNLLPKKTSDARPNELQCLFALSFTDRKGAAKTPLQRK